MNTPDSPNWTTGADELAYQTVENKVTLECLVHGVIGLMDREWIGKAEIEHRDMYGCYHEIKVYKVGSVL